MFHGVGTYTHGDDGQIYHGEWKYDKKDGIGKITWPSGITSYGPFKNGKRHGAHEFTLEDGSKKKILYDNGEQV